MTGTAVELVGPRRGRSARQSLLPPMLSKTLTVKVAKKIREINNIKANRAALSAGADIMPCNALPSWGNFACFRLGWHVGGGHDGQRFFAGILAGSGARRCRQARGHRNRQADLDRRRTLLRWRNFGQRRVCLP